MRMVDVMRATGGVMLLVLALGAAPSLAAPARQGPVADPPSADEPTTLPLCSDLSLPPRLTANSATGTMTAEGIRDAPSAGSSAEEQSVAAQGASLGGFTVENGPDLQGGTGAIACADTPAAS